MAKNINDSLDNWDNPLIRKKLFARSNSKPDITVFAKCSELYKYEDEDDDGMMRLVPYQSACNCRVGLTICDVCKYQEKRTIHEALYPEKMKRTNEENERFKDFIASLNPDGTAPKKE